MVAGAERSARLEDAVGFEEDLGASDAPEDADSGDGGDAGIAQDRATRVKGGEADVLSQVLAGQELAPAAQDGSRVVIGDHPGRRIAGEEGGQIASARPEGELKDDAVKRGEFVAGFLRRAGSRGAVDAVAPVLLPEAVELEQPVESFS